MANGDGRHHDHAVARRDPDQTGHRHAAVLRRRAEVVDDEGKEVPTNTGGKLVIRKPWPCMLRGIWGDKQRYKEIYWSEVKGSYFTGDGAGRTRTAISGSWAASMTC